MFHLDLKGSRQILTYNVLYYIAVETSNYNIKKTPRHSYVPKDTTKRDPK